MPERTPAPVVPPQHGGVFLVQLIWRRYTGPALSMDNKSES